MLIDDLTVEVRDSSLARVGQILASDLVGSEFVPRFNNVGAWKIVLRASHPLADTLRSPGSGIIVTRTDGTVILSGPTRSAKIAKTAKDPEGVWEIVGVDDSVVLAQRLAYPDPTTADVTLQASDYDVRTGAAETVVKGYIDDNIGPSAPTARKIPALTIDADLARGDTVTGKARFDKLGELLTSLASTSGLGFTIDQDGADLVFRVYEPVDRSATVRMDVDNARLSKSEYSYTVPTATRVIVAGQGTGVDRTFVEVTTTESTSAESDWGQRIEVFKDQRNTNDSTELEQAGAEVLADGGFTIESVSVSPSDDQTMRYGDDWGLGDRVTVVVGSDEIVQVVTEVAIVVTSDGVKVGATVGDPYVASGSDPETALAATASDQESRISNLERNEPASSGGTGSVAWDDVTGKPTTFTPATHAASHGSAGSDPVTLAQSQVTGLSTALAGKVDTTDARLTDARTPTAHASTHASGGSDALTLAQSQVTNLTTDLASKAPIADPTLTGTVTAPTLRLTATGDAGVSSTTHAFQIGASSSTNLIIDQNEIIARNNGALSTLTLNAGGNVTIGNSSSTVTLGGRLSATHYPFAMSAGAFTVTGNGTQFVTATVTFPASRFTQTPIITATPASSSATYFASTNNPTATSFTIRLTIASGTFSTAQTIHWQAVQMTSASGSG